MQFKLSCCQCKIDFYGNKIFYVTFMVTKKKICHRFTINKENKYTKENHQFTKEKRKRSKMKEKNKKAE